MLYVQLRKALYSTLQAALLFWKLLSGMLIEWTDMEVTSKTLVVNHLWEGTIISSPGDEITISMPVYQTRYPVQEFKNLRKTTTRCLLD